MHENKVQNKADFVNWAKGVEKFWDFSDVSIANIKRYNSPTHSMRKLWRKWMDETSEFMRKNGVTMPLYTKKDGESFGKRMFNSQDAHELFISQWGGINENGKRKSTSDSGDKSEMLYIMEKHSAWATERGLNLTMPEDCKFFSAQ